MTLFELFSIVLMGIIVLIGIGVILGLILVGVIIINYFRWRHQEKRQPESGDRMGKRKYYFPPKAEKKPITISDDVKEELKKLADKYADDPPAYANQIKERFKKIGVKAFTKSDDATPQLEDHVERNDDK